MQAAKLKVGNKGFLVFDGEFVTDGHIAYRKEMGEVSNKAIQVLINSNQKFDRSHYSDELRLNGEAKLPDIKGCIPDISEYQDAEITNEGRRYSGPTEGWLVKVKTKIESDVFAWIDERFIKFIEPILEQYSGQARKYQLKIKNGDCALAMTDHEEKVVALIMPVRN